MCSRRSKASSMILARSACDMWRNPLRNPQKPPDALSKMGREESSRCLAGRAPQARRLGLSSAVTCSAAAGDGFQKSDEIVGDVVDVRRIAPFELPALAEYFAGVFGHHQHRRHAQRMRYHEIACQVLKHRSLGGVDIVRLEKSIISLR